MENHPYQKSSQQQNYRVKDLYEAAVHYAKGQKLIQLEREGHFYWFIFSNKTQCEEVADAYWRGDCTVNAKAYADAIRTLKDRLFAQR